MGKSYIVDMLYVRKNEQTKEGWVYFRSLGSSWGYRENKRNVNKDGNFKFEKKVWNVEEWRDCDELNFFKERVIKTEESKVEQVEKQGEQVEESDITEVKQFGNTIEFMYKDHKVVAQHGEIKSNLPQEVNEQLKKWFYETDDEVSKEKADIEVQETGEIRETKKDMIKYCVASVSIYGNEHEISFLAYQKGSYGLHKVSNWDDEYVLWYDTEKEALEHRVEPNQCVLPRRLEK